MTDTNVKLMAQRGRLRGVKYNGEWFIDPDSIAAYKPTLQAGKKRKR